MRIAASDDAKILEPIHRMPRLTHMLLHRGAQVRFVLDQQNSHNSSRVLTSMGPSYICHHADVTLKAEHCAGISEEGYFL